MASTADFMRDRQADLLFDREPRALPCHGHMPFVGHRTQETIRLIRGRSARAYGYEG